MKEEECVRLYERLEALPKGTYVMMVVHEDAARNISMDARDIISGYLGSRDILRLKYRDAWAFIGIVGKEFEECME